MCPYVPLVVLLLVCSSAAAQIGSISPSSAVTTLTGTVTRSNESFSQLTIEDPGVVTLTNIQARSITFISTSRRLLGDRRAATTHVTISDSTIGSGGVKVASAFGGMEFTIERCTITATDATSQVPLLHLQTMSGGSFTVRDSTLTGRPIFYIPSTITDAVLVFENTTFSASGLCTTCSAVMHLHFEGQLLRTTVTFDRSSIRSTLSETTRKNGTALRFRQLDQSTVTITRTFVYFQNSHATIFIDVHEFRGSCITIANSSVTQVCTGVACNAAVSYLFYSNQPPSGSSFLTLDSVNVNMHSYYAIAFYFGHLHNIDILMKNVTATMPATGLASAFMFGLYPTRSVIAMVDSRVTMSSGYVFRFSTATFTSLLALRNTFSTHAMYSSVSRLNAKHGCNTYLKGDSSYLGSETNNCSVIFPGPCATASNVYAALGISSDKEYSGGGASPPPTSGGGGNSRIVPDSPSGGSKVWIIGPVLGGACIVGFVAIAIFFLQRRNGEEKNNASSADEREGVSKDPHLSREKETQSSNEFSPSKPNEDPPHILRESPNDHARLNEGVRDEMARPPAAVAASEEPGIGDVGAQRSEALTAGGVGEGDVIHPLIVAQQQLAAVTRGEAAPPVEIPLSYAEYATKAFERCRWRSPDGRSASFQAHDLYAGILYPYALSVTAYSATSDVRRLGLDFAACARAIQGASGPTVYGVCVRRAVSAEESRHLLDQAGLHGDELCEAGTFFVYVVTPFEPERLSVQSLLADTATSSESTLMSGGLSPVHRQVICSRVAAMYSKARPEGVHCALHPAAVFVDPHQQTVSLKDRRVDGIPDEATAAAELLEFVRSVNPDVDRSVIVATVAEAVAIAQAGGVTPEPSLAFLDDDSFPMKVSAECSICYCQITSADAHLMGAECCAPARHFVCEDCINMRVSASLTDAKTDFTSLPCAMAPGCTSVWAFDDFGALVSPQNLRKWHNLSMQHAQREARQEAQANMAALQQQLTSGNNKHQ